MELFLDARENAAQVILGKSMATLFWVANPSLSISQIFITNKQVFSA